MVEIVLYVDDARVLQVLLLTDGGLSAIRVGRGEELPEGSPSLVIIACHGDVLLLVHGFQLGVETTDYHVLEAIALNLRPVLDLVVRDVLYIASHVIAGVGIGTFTSDACHQLVVLVRDIVSGGKLGDGINLVISLLALCWVDEFAIRLVSASDLIEVRLLLLHVGGAEMGGALEHQMLQIVSQTGGLGRVVSRTCLHGDVSLQARLLLVN